MTLEIEVVDRSTLETILGLERTFVERWLNAEKETIPALPRLEVGRHPKFHLPTVRRWLLKYFQQGGDPV